MAIIDTVLEIIRSPRNGMRLKNPLILDIKNTDVSYLALTGGAQGSVMGWLGKYYKEDLVEIKKEDVSKHTKDVFAILGKPHHRYWTGIVEWSSNFGTYEWWQHDDIMSWFPHFDRYTLRYSEQIAQVPSVKYTFKVGRDLSDNMKTFINEHGLKIKWDFPHVYPRYKWAPEITKIYDEVLPKFKNIVESSPELSRTLEDYLAPDQELYEKAQ